MAWHRGKFSSGRDRGSEIVSEQGFKPRLSERLLIWYARQFPVRRGKLRIVNSFWRPAIGRGSLRRIADLKYGGLSLPVDLGEQLQRQFYFFGTYFIEDAILDCWQAVARDSSVIFDVGANAGI